MTTYSSAFHTNSDMLGYIVKLPIENKSSAVRQLQHFSVLEDETNRDAFPLSICHFRPDLN